ncbi:glycosyltransferase [Pontibacter sp. 13R65]|uniref:glycosyltransferase n=1 Tax=Pontibacter sp. 13R65 TaxID=3127458 RepID=UPI00301D858A
MAKFLYIGQYSDGSTSKMRGEKLKEIFSHMEFIVIDTNIPYNNSSRIFKSLAFRFKTGPVIKKLNQYILDRIKNTHYDLIWIDKGIYINKSTIAIVRNLTSKLVHFTPDPAFTFHKSAHFNACCKNYDYLVTTKLFEVDIYKRKCNGKIIYATQGFDKNIHYPRHHYSEKQGVSFIGHFEKERGVAIQALIDNKIIVKLAGIKWEDFVRKNRNNEYLIYCGTGVFGDAYSNLISSSLFALGSVSKWIPELHTTRTFEIPACGTALLTEANIETSSFFEKDEVIFYNDIPDLINRIQYYSSHPDELQLLTKKGYHKVQNKFEYGYLMQEVVKEINK